MNHQGNDYTNQHFALLEEQQAGFALIVVVNSRSSTRSVDMNLARPFKAGKQ
jgi:hypothetical protein